MSRFRSHDDRMELRKRVYSFVRTDRSVHYNLNYFRAIFFLLLYDDLRLGQRALR